MHCADLVFIRITKKRILGNWMHINPEIGKNQSNRIKKPLLKVYVKSLHCLTPDLVFLNFSIDRMGR
jgi:hypothetical protein